MDRSRLETTDRGPTVIHDGRCLYSKRYPSRTPDRIADSASVEDRCLYLVPSPLLGYGLRVLVGRIPESSHIIAFECSTELFALCSPSLPSDLVGHPRISWARLSDVQSLAVLMGNLGPWRFRRVRRVDLNGGPSVSPALYDELCAFAAARLANYWRNRHALSRMGRSWIRHLYSNLAAVASNEFRSVRNLGADASRVTVVVGAGPSLEEGIGFLSEHKNLIRVICTDTALPALLSAGIKPDAVSVLETQAWNLLDFHGAAGSGIPVIADITSYPPTMTATGGPVMLFSSSFADLDFIDRLDYSGMRPLPLPPLGSVGLSSVELALRLTNGPVLLSGLDFAYAPGKSHARGTSVHLWQLSVRDRMNPHPGFSETMRRPRAESSNSAGRRLRTDTVLKGYADLFVDRYSGEERLSVLAPGGIVLGVPVLDGKDASKLVHSAAKTIADSHRRGKVPDGPAIRASDAFVFLASELEFLDTVINAWDAYAAGDCESEEVVRALEGGDQIFCDFPDEPPLPRDDDAFLVRAVKRTRSLERLIRRSLP